MGGGRDGRRERWEEGETGGGRDGRRERWEEGETAGGGKTNNYHNNCLTKHHITKVTNTISYTSTV